MAIVESTNTTSINSPGASSALMVPFIASGRSRRGSLASISSKKGVDKETLAQALDEIHTTASRSDGLTSFHDFDGEGRSSGAKELVSNGISGMYNRLRQSVAGGGGGGGGGGSASTSSGSGREKDVGRSRPKSIESRESLDTGSMQSMPSSPLMNRSRTQQQLNARKPASADQQSVASLNVPASPVVRTTHSSNEQSESKSGTPQLHLHTADGQPIPAVGVRDSREPSVDSARAPATHPLAKTKSAPDVPTKEDVEKARSAWNGDRSAEGTDALARVLSHHEVSLTDQPKQISQARLRDDLEEAIEDSDYADDPEPLFPAPSQPLPPPAAASNPQHAASEARQPRRPPMLRVGVSHLPGFDPSRASSTMDGSEGSSAPSSRATSYRKPSVEPAANINTALGRKRSTLKSGSVSDKSQSSSKQRHVLDRKFWMQDEGARVCFSCGQSFSTFRRKHHCRSCGQIFDAKCTSLHPGRQFGQTSDVRLCKLCESVIMGSDDDSTVFSDEDRDDYTRSPLAHNSRADHDEMIGRLDGSAFSRTDTEVMTPSIGIPVSRRNREAKRRSAVIEFDDSRTLARPSSSHSLISLSRRPRSSSHRRRHSKHHPSSRLVRSSVDIERGPFHQGVAEDVEKRQLPTFHKDNIIDPDLADYLSDDGSEDGQHQSIMATLEGPSASPGERDKLGFAGLLSSAFTKGRSRGADRRLAQGFSIQGDKAEEARTTLGRPRSRHLSDVPVARASPRASQSNLVPQSNAGEMLPRPRTPSGQTTHAKVTCSPALQQNRPTDDLELYPASEEHVRKLLAQLLWDAQVPHARAWQQALLPVLMQCTNDVEPDVQAGDDMDIRHYIKLKKIPGGKPRDTGYVSGIVFSKNIALKSMARTLANPKILIVNFSIEYARHEAHFMSLEPILAQETEYLKNLVKRIAQLKPDVLLVQKHVSGKALLMLEEENITVAYNIKESVLAAIARVTMTSPVKSVEKLTMMSYDSLGICESFDVKTYVTEGLRKTYIYLSGCQPDLGCTVVLRGADTKILRKIKRIAEFMCYVAYSLKLENSLMRDEFVSIPRTVDSQDGTHRHTNDAVPAEDRQLTINETLQQEIEKGNANLHFKYEEQERESRKRILSASPFVIFMQPYLLTQLRDLERRLATYKMLRDQYAAADEDGDDVSNEKDELEIKENFSLVKPDMVNAPASKDQPKAVREYLHAVHEAQLQKAKHTFEVQERQWESFQNGEVNPFDPFSHQKIVVLYSTVSSITSAPCTGPELLGLGFYASYGRTDPYHEDDLTLGQYIQEMCAAALKTCGDCSKKMSDHHRQYVHGYGQLTVSTQRQQTKVRGMHDQILMWSTCRLCRHETTVTQMSSHTWKYSFAKYLELSFWSSPLHPRAGLCKHDIHRDFLRCFGFHDTVVRVQYDPIDIYDVIVPKAQVTWKVEADLTVKNEQYQLFEERLQAFVNSVRQRLDMITVDNVNEKTAEAAYALVEELRMKLEVDERELKEKLQLKYAKSRYYELIPLNRALRFMDEKAIAWDDEFARFEEKYFPSEADIRKIAVDQMRKMFLESQPARSTTGSEAGSDTEDGFETSNARRTPHARDELLGQKAQDVLSSAMEEHTAAADETDPLRPVKSHDPSGLLGTELVRVTTPRKELEEAVERDDVKHLDLAVPTQSPPPVLVGDTLDELSPRKSPEDTSEHDSRTEEPFAIQPKPLSSGLLERIEQIRNNKANTGADEVPETRIPRLADLQQKQRDASPSPAARPVPPPLLRAKSQPGHPGHAHRLSADATMNNPSIDAVTTSQEQSGEGENHGIDKRLGDRLGVGRLTNKVGKVAPSLIPRSIPAKHEESFPSTVSALAKHFEQMSREFEKERLKERRQRATRSRQARANPLASSRPVVEVYQNAVDAVGERPPTVQDLELEQERERAARREMDEIVAQNQPEDHSISEADKHALDDDGHITDHEAEASTLAGDTVIDADDEMSDNEHGLSRSRDTSDPSSSLQSPSTTGPDLHDLGPDGQIGEQRKNQWFKYLAEFWSKRSASGWGNLEYPLHATEHVFEDSDIIVREDEPSSVIALSLACADYQVKEKGFRKAPNRQPLAKHGHAHSTSTASTANLSSAEGQRADIEASLLGDVATHMKYSFAHGQVKASCKIFYAESFDALRRRCGVADRFMESMSRCLKFDSKGGKTKSLFLRTLDSRFIIKSLQEVELKAFTKFAPDYFNFMSYTLFHGVPSVIAKMFGLFQVNIRNPATGVDFSYYLLVMENLFYERSPNRRFDLKGSMRNRKIEATGQADEVLLDENLVETIFESPLFVREHSRKLLQASVFNDTLWLCKQNVMDYSLMAGFDDTRKELVVGIIDCIRTYTWDKKLESWIKDRGKNKPTITSPKDYRNRFRVSMMQYVLQAPNCWWSFQVNLGTPKTLREGEGQGATVEGDVTETGDDMS